MSLMFTKIACWRKSPKLDAQRSSSGQSLDLSLIVSWCDGQDIWKVATSYFQLCYYSNAEKSKANFKLHERKKYKLNESGFALNGFANGNFLLTRKLKLIIFFERKT